MQNYLRGNTDHQQFENDKQNVDVASPGQISADAHEWSCFLAFAFCYFSAGVLNQWEISSMQWEILSDLVQGEIALLQYLRKEI